MPFILLCSVMTCLDALSVVLSRYKCKKVSVAIQVSWVGFLADGLGRG